MTMSVRLTARIEMPELVPVLNTKAPRWDRKRAGGLAAALGVSADAVDAGPWYIARDDRQVVEVYQGSNSFRVSRLDIDGEARDGGDGALDPDSATVVATDWLTPFWPAEAERSVLAVTEREVLVATRDDGEPRRLIAGLDVNVCFTHREFALLGPGAKAKVTVDRDGHVVAAYKFWRDLAPIGEVRTRSFDEIYERFSASDLFAGLDDSIAAAEVTSGRFGYLTLPPTEPMPRLCPAVELRGTLDTEHQRYEFTRFVAAVDVPRELESGKVANATPALVIA